MPIIQYITLEHRHGLIDDIGVLITRNTTFNILGSQARLFHFCLSPRTTLHRLTSESEFDIFSVCDDSEWKLTRPLAQPTTLGPAGD